MNNSQALKEKLTLLICSCDSYADLWMPFFTLLKKYWAPFDLHIILNTESKDFAFDGLDIECVHSPAEKRYGQRMLNALSHVKTEYVLLMLDDFFIRTPVCEQRIQQLISWMDADKNIAYFSCEPLATYADYEVDAYPGFKRIPPANNYTLNMQAAIWKTEIFKSFWSPEPTPWEWENFYTLLTLKKPQYKFYTATNPENSFLNYGHYAPGDIWGVYRGKWIVEDVEPFFKKEGINIDLSIRGSYSKDIPSAPGKKSFSDIWRKCRVFCHTRNIFEVPFYVGGEIYRIIRSLLKRPTEWNYVTHILDKERKRFISSLNKTQTQ